MPSTRSRTPVRAQPKYQRLKNHFLTQLKTGRLKPGQALPSEDSLADQFHVARSTVRQAIGELERHGLVRRVQGSGTYVEELVRHRLKSDLQLFALVVPVMRTGYYLWLQHGFEMACKTSHHQIIVCCSEDDLARQSDLLVQLMDKSVSGIALLPVPSAPTPAYQLRQVRRQGIPLVLLHRGVEEIQAPVLAMPFREIGRRAGELLARHGHRRVAYFPAQRMGASGEYEHGLREALRAAGGDLPEQFIYQSPGSHVLLSQQEESVAAALKNMCARKDRPTAIMASFDPDAELIYLMLSEMGIRVPQQMSLVSFGGATRESAMLQRITSVTVDEAALGGRAAQWLYEMHTGDRPLDSDERVIVPLELSQGRTLGPAPAAPGPLDL